MKFTLENFVQWADEAVRTIEYPSAAPGLYAPIRYALASGGKRLRAALCLAAYSAVTHTEPAAALGTAAAVEMFHNFTLLHDDVMDNADVRRGAPTVHRRWGSNAAILSGDAMLTMASQLLVSQGGPNMKAAMECFDTTAMEVYQGQQYDMEFESRSDVTFDEYMEMIRLKTAVLLGAACRLGVMAADGPRGCMDAFYDYGVALGLAFQLRDDYLDTFGDAAIFGKAIGGDILNRKKTMMYIAAAEKDTTFTELWECGYTDEELIAAVAGRYRTLGVALDCQALADRYSAGAIAALKDVEMDHDARTFFTDLAHYSSNRDH